LDALTTNTTFLGRVRTAVRNHATTLLAGTPTTVQRDWSTNVYYAGKRSNQIAADLAPQVVEDPAIKNSTTGDASDVTDAALQAAVDVICENYH
jgi:hypothetical protein